MVSLNDKRLTPLFSIHYSLFSILFLYKHTPQGQAWQAEHSHTGPFETTATSATGQLRQLPVTPPEDDNQNNNHFEQYKTEGPHPIYTL